MSLTPAEWAELDAAERRCVEAAAAYAASGHLPAMDDSLMHDVFDTEQDFDLLFQSYRRAAVDALRPKCETCEGTGNEYAGCDCGDPECNTWPCAACNGTGWAQ